MKIYYAHSHFFMKLFTLLQRIHFPSCSQFVHIILLPIPRSEEIFYTSFKDSKKEQPLDNAAWRFATAITESLGKTERCAKNNPVQPGLLAICYMGKRTKKKKNEKRTAVLPTPINHEKQTVKKIIQPGPTLSYTSRICFSSVIFVYFYLLMYFFQTRIPPS